MHEHVPKHVLAKKYKIDWRRVNKILQQGEEQYSDFSARKNVRVKFKKLHTRSRKFISEFIKEATAPIQSSDI